jgi:two-component system sensor histidine kinase UhpB
MTMSLRTRLVLWLGGVLAVTLSLGCALAGLHAAASVRAEMQSALATGRQAIANNMDEIAHSAPAADDGAREMRHLIVSFDGNRHVQATFRDRMGAVVAASVLQPPSRPVPKWFRRAISPTLAPVVLTVPPGTIPAGSIILTANPTNEVGEVWDQTNDAVRTLALFFVLTVLLIYWTVGRALRPLTTPPGSTWPARRSSPTWPPASIAWPSSLAREGRITGYCRSSC